jgi:hypothetical protein
VANAHAASPVALDADVLATRFSARGPWKKRLPQLLDMLAVLGRAREQDGRLQPPVSPPGFSPGQPPHRALCSRRKSPRFARAVGRALPAASAFASWPCM